MDEEKKPLEANIGNADMLFIFMSSAALASYPKTFTDTQGREITLDEARRG